MQLDARKKQILKQMGIDIWVERAPSDVVPADTIEETPRAPAAPVNKDISKASEVPGLASIRSEVSACQRCELHKTRKNTVFGAGADSADWLFIGEAPGQNEDQQGLPFVGRAGQLLTKMIEAIGQQREQVFIANVLKCRPPNNRDPKPEEIVACEPYLHQQIALLKPKVIVALGRISAQALLKETKPLGRMRGTVYAYGETKTPLVVTYHPAYLLRTPIDKRKTWQDLLLAKSVVDTANQ